MSLSKLISLVESRRGPIFVVVKDEAAARELANLLGGGHFPAHDVFPFDSFPPSTEVIRARLQIVKSVIEGEIKTLVGTLRAFLTPTLPMDAFRNFSFELRRGNIISEQLIHTLPISGYRRSYIVRTPGQFAVRGMIVDIFDLPTRTPYRIERDGDTIVEIDLFDPMTQRSSKKVVYAQIHPAREWLSTRETYDVVARRLQNSMVEMEDLDPILDRMPGVTQEKPHYLWQDFRTYNIILVDSKRSFEALEEFLEEVNDSMVNTALREVFLKYSFGSVKAFLEGGKVTKLELEGVWAVRRSGSQPTQVASTELSEEDIEDFEFGEPVVHEDYGVGICEGVKTIGTVLGKREYLVVRYRDGYVYVPLDMFHKVHKYIGSGFLRLDSVSPAPWKRRVESVKRELEEQFLSIARIYAIKRMIKRPPFLPVPELEESLKSEFPYPETEGQKRAIEDVLSDLEGEHPMDRLVTGDAGYGKTEVAIRAAMRVVANGGQVVVLVPTTILARQHFRTFKERLGKLGVEIAILDGRTPGSERRRIFESASRGTLDILIGTHAVLSNKLRFANLRLVVVDEEQRFGVNQKEKLRCLKERVDYLSMSATPIPRTLQLALSGIKDLSIISTPPLNRRPVITTVAPYSENIVRTAILRELERGGQVLYVHNRVADLDRIAKRVSLLAPHARVGLVHGRMGKACMTNVAERFHRREIDVLVSTSVVQFGLDEPNANTIIVDDAHRYGVSDLYQLRGRVGRSDRRAFAYFLYDPQRDGKIPKERLKMLKELQKPGSAFRLALMDLEVRGAGEILGLKQHGKIDSVGLIFYNKMLAEIVRGIKSGYPVTHEEEELQMSGIPIDLLIPPEYVEDTLERVRLYRRISASQSQDTIEDIERELRERFGPLPKAVKELLRYVRVKIALKEKGVRSIEYDVDRKKLVLEFSDLSSVNLRNFVRRGATIQQDRLLFSSAKREEILKLLEKLAKN